MEKETIPGFDIEVRELTEEEATREVTFERFSNFHIDAGEDFCDTCGYPLIDHKAFGEFIKEKHPEMSDEVDEVCESKYGEALALSEIYNEHYEYPKSYESFYGDLAQWINASENKKMIHDVNMILIRLDEDYNP